MNNVLNMMNMLNKLTKNPAQTLLESGLNVPNEIANNPQQIVQYLLNSGQVNQQQVNQAMQMKDSPMFRGLIK